MKKIVCVHLLNDFSGSPLVLSDAVKAFVQAGYEVDLFTSSSQGFLTGIEQVNYRILPYRWSSFKLVTLLFWFWSQCVLFFKLRAYKKEDVILYVNTLLPFGAALAGRFMNKKVVYHIHETSVRPILLKRFLKFIVKKCADVILYVSDDLRKREEVQGKKNVTVYNALATSFSDISSRYERADENRLLSQVLMLCSLKSYKGVDDYVALSKLLPEYTFNLILNSDRESIDEYFNDQELPTNLLIHAAQSDVHIFYQDADLVLNLSHPDRWIETFGMTALEAMSYGIPVIVPPVGGISELVTQDFNGYKVDVKELQTIEGLIRKIFSNRSLYNYLSANARQKAGDFNIEVFQRKVLEAVS